MDTQDNLNLAVEYLEVVTCTYKELCAIKKPTNGRLYHTSDTNEFYFDWNNRRHKLSVFSTDNGGTNDYVKKSELGTWLAENNYITNLSLTDELINIIGSPIENIITKQALDNYSKNYLLTKDEISLLNEPLNLVEDIKNLQNTDKTLYSYCDRLANQINEVRTIAKGKLSSGELDTKLNDYLKKSLAESLYMKKDDANTLFIDEEEFAEKIADYVTREQLTESLLPYQKTSVADGKYTTKSEADDKYLQKSAANKTYATKNEVSETYETKDGVDEKLEGYLKKTDTAEFAKKSEVESSFVKKEDLNKYETKSGVGEKLSAFATKMWVEEYYLQKEHLKRELNNYATKDYVSEMLSDYATNSSVDEKVSQVNNELTNVKNRISGFATKAQLQEIIDNIPTIGDYITDDELKVKLSDYEKSDDVDLKLAQYEKKEDLNDKLNNYFTKKQITDTYLPKTALKDYAKVDDVNNNLATFAKQMWVDEYYMRKFKLSDYMKSDDVYDIFIEKSVADNKYLSKTDAEKTYAKITDIIGKTTGDFVTRDEVSSFAKMMWVDEYYVRKGQIDGIQNATVLSNEFATEREIREAQRNIQQGFYYLTEDQTLIIAVDNGSGSGDKTLINITNLEADFSMYFGGDEVNW